jgi:enamine deaminase RidA (YjgF/YER057c/UK114 family)
MGVTYLNPSFLHQPVDNLYSHVSVAGPGSSYRIGGQVPVDASGANVAVGDMGGQIRTCYGCVERSLAHLGLGWRDVSHLLIFTTRIDEYLEHERIVAPAFFGDSPPPSTLVEVSRLVDPEWMVEIQADAVSETTGDLG